MLLLSCLPSYAGRHSSNIGAAAIGAAAGMFLGAAIANSSNNHCSQTCTRTEYVYEPQYRNSYYTERVEVCSPVVETRRVYTRPAVVTHYRSRPRYTEVSYNRSYAPVQYNECYTTYY